ncbi:MAG TPA: imidazolonepropionase [Puia sp.]|nr:imidazolonepropionase [Puia sp.]
MASILVTDIQQLVNTRTGSEPLRGKALSELPSVSHAYLLIEDDEIAGYGPMSELPPAGSRPAEMIRAAGQLVLPCWCDAHTHLVFAGSREGEFVDKIRGLSYAEINARGGGILNSARTLRETSPDDLFNQAWSRLQELNRLGTGALEIKSGYGLTVESELKILRVIRKLREKSGIPIRSTFLAAHSYPPEFRENHQGYIDLIIREMLPAVAGEKLADYIDVFCEKGFFSPEETETICRAGMQYGLKPRLHVNQLHSIGGIETGIRLQAVSLDHLEILNEEDIRRLSNLQAAGRGEGNWKGLCTLLPTAAFFLRMPLQPARKLIDAGCAVVLASDYNPGSSPSGNMNLVVAMSCIQMQMLPEEAINAATLNGAHALEWGDKLGSVAPGKKANLIFTKPVPSVAFLPYAFGSNLIEKVMINGRFLS